MQKKFIKILFLAAFMQIFCCVFFVLPNTVSAVDSYTFKKPLPNLEKVDFDGSTRPIAQYIQAIYNYAIGIVAILAVVVMMIGGVVWMTAAGNQTRVGEAKSWITGALTGLVLTLCSYMILNTVNPDLVTIKPVKIEKVKPISDTFYNTGCADTQHLDYAPLSSMFGETCVGLSCAPCEVTMETCQCQPGKGENVCKTKGEPRDCKLKGYIFEDVKSNTIETKCDIKAKTLSCCSKEATIVYPVMFSDKMNLVCN